jgi:hypothetical protein
MNQTPIELAKAIYDALKTNDAAKQSVRDEYARLALELASDATSAVQITSATVNGQSYAGTVQMTKGDRLTMLQWVCWMFTNGKPRTRTQAVFRGNGGGYVG